MKRIIALLLALVMCLSLFAGCNPNKNPGNETPDNNEQNAPEVVADENLDKALEYLRVYYKKAAEKTPMDYKRIATVRVANTTYPIAWSVDVGEDIIKIVDNGDGTVTIDLNEEKIKESKEPIAYVLTATLTGTDGRQVSYSWNHIIPAGIDEEAHAIIDAAYELEDGQVMEGTHTLTGVIISIDTMYSADYKNITVTIEVAGREDKPIMCYRLKGEGAEKLAIGDTITVTGTLKNYKGTIEFDAGCVLEAVEPGGQEAPTAPEDPLEILKAAFALAPGRSLPYKATLTGTIVEVNYPYTEQYGDTSVTIITNGYKLYCYRLKGPGADQLNINDVITVNGQITNYNGTIEFNYPTLVGLTNYAPPAAPTDPLQIVDEAYALADGQYLDYTATLTGVISSFKYYYSEQYQSICVYMTIAGRESKPIYCYNLKGAGIQQLDVGDTITVKGDIKNYMGTIEFVYPTLISYVLAPDELTEDEKTLNALYELQPGESLEGEYNLTGKITQINNPYSEQYGDISVTIVIEGHDDKPVLCYCMKGEGAESLAVGDTIKVTGDLTNYNGTFEFKKDCTFELIAKGEEEGGGNVGSVGTAEVLTEMPAAGDVIVIYNSGNAMTATPNGKKLAGEEAEIVDGVLEVTETMAQLTVSIDENGYYTFLCGDQYLTSGETGNSLFLADEASDYSLWTVEAATEDTWYIKNVNAKYGENVQSLEYYSGFTTYGHKETAIYQMQILKMVEETVEAPFADGDQVVIYAPAYGKALSTQKTGFYNVGVDVAMADGVLTGYSETEVFTVIDNGDGTYSFAYGEQKFGLAEAYASMDLGAINDTWTLVDLGGGLYNLQNVGRGNFMEWYASKNNWSSYNSPNAATDDQFQLSFYLVSGEDIPETPDEPEVPEIKEVTLTEANAIGAAKEHNTFTSEEYIVVGKITEIKSDVYGNMYIADEEGNTLYIYGVYDEAGNRFDAIETKPAVGDTVKLRGILGQYNGNAQMKNGVVVELIPGTPETPDEPEVPEIPEDPETDAPAASMDFVDTANRTVGEATNQTWVMNGITFVNEKAGSMTDVNIKYNDPVRCYQGSSISISYAGMTKIVITCANADHATALVNSITDAAVKADGNVVTVEFASAVNTFAVPSLTKQVRISKLDVYTGESIEAPEEPEVPEIKEVTLTEANAIGAAKEHNTFTTEEYIVVGKITEIKNDMYGNAYIVDEAGNTLYIYGIKGEDGTRYDGLEVKPVVGDTVKLRGVLGQYNGSAQMKNGVVVELIPGAPVEPPHEHSYNAVVTAPTCIEEGYTTYTCDCGESYTSDKVAALGHKFETAVTAPTCLEGGYTTYTCSVCKHSYQSDKVEALGHKFESVVTAPTCTEGGYTTYTCSACDHSYEGDKVEALGHDYVSKVIEPTVSTEGYTLYTCSRCDDSYKDHFTDKLPAPHEHVYTSVVTAPTCTEDGYTTYTCTCGGSYVADKVEALGHKYESVVTAPTCLEGGYTTNTCSVCGIVTKSDEVAATGHKFDKVVTAPTCLEGGYTTYTCSVCDHSYESDKVEALGHKFESAVTAPTCTEGGYTTYTCSVCDHSYEGDKVEALGHKYESAVTAPTCLEEGYTTYTCSACDVSYVDNKVNALGHDYVSQVIEPTTTSAGYTLHTCNRCDHSYKDNFTEKLPETPEEPPHEHDYKAVVTAPTCTEGGYTTYVCACGYEYVGDKVEALGHKYESVVTAPTCTEGGYTTNTCSVCDDVYKSDEVAALGHDYKAVVTAPTCTEGGYTTYTCSVCELSHVGDEVAALGHDYKAVVTAPTCTEGGYTTYTCSVCELSYVGDEVAALGHDYTAVVTAPTCTEGGYTTNTCSVCGDVYKSDEVAALGHDYKAVVTAPTCLEGGYTTNTCSVCGDVYKSDEVAAAGHKYEAVVTAPTCLEGGYTTNTCSVCGDVYKSDEVAAAGHKFDKVVTAPTCTEGGYTTYTCSVCDHSYESDKVDALGHDYQAVVTEPTCLEGGYTTYTCACGDTYIADETQALGHDYVSVVTAPTATTEGYTTYTCVCGDSYKADYVAPTDPAAIIAAAYALEAGAALPYEATLTGKIVSIDTIYSQQYNNITVTIVVEGHENQPIKCFRMKGEGIAELKVNDQITVTGNIKNYNGTVEFDTGCVVSNIIAAPEEPAEPTVVTLTEANAIGAAKEHNTFTTEEYIVEGKITEIKSDIYGNMYIADDAGNTLYVYGVYDEAGNRYDAMETKPAVGDTVKLCGVLGQYNGSAQMKNGVVVELIPGTPETPEEPEVPEIPEDPETDVPTASMDFVDTANRTVGEATNQTWVMNGITFVNEKAGSSSDVNIKYNDPVRCYQGSSISISYAGMTKIVITCANADYATALVNSITDATATAEDTVVTVEFASAVDTFIVASLTKQVRISKVDIYAGESSETPEEPEVPEIKEVTLTEANAIGAAKEHNTFTTEEYIVEGKITEIKNDMYGNAYITDEAGNTLYIYGIKGEDGTRYDGLEVKPVVGDTVKLRGVLGQYNGSAQMKNGVVVELIPGTPETPEEPEVPETPDEPETPEQPETPAAPFVGGDQVVIYAPAYGKALSTQKTDFYNVGVDVTYTDGVLTGYGETEIFTVVDNGDGTYSFTYGGQNFGLGESYSSMDLGAVNGTWTLVDLGNGLYNIQNVGRGNFMEWYASKNNWSSYNSSSAATDDQFQLSFYVVTGLEIPETPETPEEPEAPVVPETLAEQITEAGKLANNTYLSYESTATGVVEGDVIASSKTEGQFKFNIRIDENTKLTCYYVPVTNGTPAEGDTVTVTGKLTAYNGNAQFDSTASATIDAKAETPEEGETPDTPNGDNTSVLAASLSFDDVSIRTEFDTEHQVWTSGGITFVNNKAGSTSNVADYSAPVRVYKSSEVSISYAGMTKLVVSCANESYANAFANSIADANATVTVNGTDVEIVFASPASTLYIAALSAQVRINRIDVYVG